MPKRVLAGIRASGRLHLGNYFGAVKGMLDLQADPTYQTFYMVADAHTITTPYDPAELSQNRQEIIIDYLAAGLDPQKSHLFFQSQVSAHFELTFYLSSLCSVARMQHLPTFKEKVSQHPDQVTMALLNYPVLMAADILLYQAELVPAGVDQEPHLEVARELARKINATYGLNFPEPVRFITEGESIPSLKGEGKMSKSVAGSFINLDDDLPTIQQRLTAAPTDSGRGQIKLATKNPNQPVKAVAAAGDEYVDGQTNQPSPGVASLLTFVELFEGKAKKKYYQDLYQGSGIKYRDLKAELAAAIVHQLAPIQAKRVELVANPKYVATVIASGNEAARQVGQQTLTQLKEKMGLL